MSCGYEKKYPKILSKGDFCYQEKPDSGTTHRWVWDSLPRPFTTKEAKYRTIYLDLK
jgi:hypothetical protein